MMIYSGVSYFFWECFIDYIIVSSFSLTSTLEIRILWSVIGNKMLVANINLIELDIQLIDELSDRQLSCLSSMHNQ